MSVDLPLGRLDWTGVSVQRLNERVNRDPTLGRSAVPDRNSTVYFPLCSRYSRMKQKVAGSLAPERGGVSLQPSAFKCDFIAVIRIEALIQTAHHVLEKPKRFLPVPFRDDIRQRYSSWIRHYCDSHYLHFLHDQTLQKTAARLDPAWTCPIRLASPLVIVGGRNRELGHLSSGQLYRTFTRNESNLELRKQGETVLVEQHTILRKGNQVHEVVSEFCSRQNTTAFSVTAICTIMEGVYQHKGMVGCGGPLVNDMNWRVSAGSTDPEREEDGEVGTQQTGNTFDNGGNDHGKSVHQHQRNATWPTIAGKKRSANAEESSDDNDDDDDGWRPRKRVAHSEKSPRFACPFYQHDRDRFGSERTCSGPGWATVQRVKEHLFRKHKAPDHQCPRCFKEFENSQSKMQHCQAQESCKIGKSPSALGQLDENAMRLLKQRGKATMTESEKWYSVYQILFPMETSFPSPYYEKKGKGPELPPKTVAQGMFRENLDGVLSKWGLSDTQPMMDKPDKSSLLNLIKYGAIAAFDETLSAMYRQRAGPALDDKTPAISVSDAEGGHQAQWLCPLVEDLDAEGKNPSQGHRIDQASECALTNCSSSNLNTETLEVGMEEGKGSQRSNRKALTSPVSEVDGQTVETSAWHPEPQTSSTSQSLQRQAHQQGQGRVRAGQNSCRMSLNNHFTCICGRSVEGMEHYRIDQRLICRRDRPMERYAPAHTSTSYPRQGRYDARICPLTPVETPEDGNRIVFDHRLVNVDFAHNDTPVEVPDDNYISDIPRSGDKGKGVEGEDKLLDTDTSNHWIRNEVDIYEPPALPYPWQVGLDGIWCPNHPDGNSQTFTDSNGFEDSVVSPYLKGNHHYGT